jgi:hypothetical protein
VTKATVTEIVREGLRGPYCVAFVDDLEDWVTFSLNPPVWHEKNYPEVNDVVLLSDIRKGAKKRWRAMQARFFRPQDEKEENRRQE